MIKKEIVAALAERCDLNKKDAEKVLVTFTDIVKEELAKGGKIQITGFGTFEVIERAERMGRNPSSGEPMMIAATKSPKFKAGKFLKDAVNV